MASKTTYLKYDPRMSEEFQLLAEERWIIDTLMKIKNQRNCLQIERLHLESLKAKIKNDTNKITSSKVNEPKASTSAINLMQNVTAMSTVDKPETAEARLDDVACNEEELNLVVTNPVFNKNTNSDFNMEEDDELGSDDDMFIDMNMLMNGTFK